MLNPTGGTDLTPETQERLLTPELLLALQFHARGYALAQIAPLVGHTPDGAATLLSLASRRLGTATLAAAVAEARRRGLIV